jgi:alpha-L-arabinofuranosidase
VNTVRIQARLQADAPGPAVSRQVFGHFIEHLGGCVYGGLWVGEDSAVPNRGGWRTDAIEALRAIGAPNLRWPGGCFADDYHWRDGIGPRAGRPQGTSAWWGEPEPNTVGTHEFLALCEAVGAEPYVCGNVGSGTVQEMRDWIEYLNAPRGASSLARMREAHGRPEPARVRLWAVGNENWGCGGNMRPEYYADLYRRFATFLRDFPGAPLFRVGCGPRDGDEAWTEIMMRECGRALLGDQRVMQGLALHSYCVPGDFPPRKSATEFGEAEWDELMGLAAGMDERVARHRAVMDRHDPDGYVALVVDEWGAWHAPEPGTPPGHFFQQNTVRDAVMAALTLNIFIGHAERVRIANLAQTMNVIHAVLLSRGPALVRTPTWDVFRMYRPHHDARRLPLKIDGPVLGGNGFTYPAVSAAATVAGDGVRTITWCNLAYGMPAEVELHVDGADGVAAEATVLTAPRPQAHNTFEQPGAVREVPFEGVRRSAGGWCLTLPPHSVVALTLR